jgi:hypothetical protein
MLIYSIPPNLVPNYTNKKITIRITHPDQLLDIDFSELPDLCGLELANVPLNEGFLRNIPEELPITVIVNGVDADLLNFIRDSNRKQQFTIGLVSGNGLFESLKKWSCIGLPIHILLQDFSDQVIGELEKSADFYLHDNSVEGPIEFFHSFFTACYSQQPVSLWQIQGEDPSQFAYITNDGTRRLSRRFEERIPADCESFLDDLKLNLFLNVSLCSTCEFFLNCFGYFKYPDPTFSCAEIKMLLRKFKDAAKEIRAFQETEMASFEDLSSCDCVKCIEP